MNMTREQIEAWLALEGWEHGRLPFYVPMYHKGGNLAFITNSGVPRYRTRRIDENGFIPEAPSYTDDQLQLIYQEITNHETH